MELIRNWVVGIVAAVLIFHLADMLMPEGNIRKVSKMAVGLILIAIMVSPLLDLVGTKGTFQAIFRQQLQNVEEQRMELEVETKSPKDAAWEVYIRNNTNINEK